MADAPLLSHFRFIPAPPRQINLGVFGYVAFRLCGAVTVGGIAVRRGADGRTALQWPVIPLAHRATPAIEPVDEAVRHEIERQVFEALGIDDGVRA